MAPFPVARAQDGCTNATLKGAYGYVVNGTLYDQQGYVYYYAASGRMVANGDGALSNSDTLSFDGTITRNRQFTGTYNINADCTGTASFTNSAGATVLNMDLVLTGAGKEVSMIEYDGGVIITGTAKQQ